ncbi:MAG TPA: Druantia anti-phage system protein DruA [Clostridiaceae bacterium]
MDDIIIVFSGREITSKDIELLKWTRKKYPQLSRSELASTFCEFIGWVTPAGCPKKPQCRLLFDKLELKGFVELPPARINSKKNKKLLIPNYDIDITPIECKLSDIAPVYLEISRAGLDLMLWRKYINDYHMLGYKHAFGSALQYFVKSGDKKLGCIQFSASSWALKPREEWIGWTIEDRKARLNLILNNSRYLIFPWVNISNLASKALSIAIKQVQEDWLREYCYAPVLLETFVDLSHFAGTCYKASNWTFLGETKGRGRMDKNHEAALSPKAIYVYPLQKDFKDCLKGIKPCKVANPDE